MVDISVIIPMYKGEKYLAYWLNILSENFKEIQKEYNVECEAIFINDYPEKRIEIDNKLENIKVYNLEHNKGIHGARVFGYYKSIGNYIIFLDQDDKISKDYLFCQRRNIEGADAIVCNGYKERFWIRGKRTIYIKKELLKRIEDPNNYFLKENEILSPGQVLIKKDSIPDIWLTEIQKENGADDYFLWILMRKKGCKFKTNYQKLYTHVEHGENTSNQSESMHNSIVEMISYLEKNSILEKEQIKELYRKEYEKDNVVRQYVSMVKIYDYWMYLKIKGVNLEKYFNNHNYKNIAIYGMNYIGNRLYDELDGTSVNTIFGIDKAGDSIVYEVPILNIKNPEFIKRVNEVDIVVVTVIDSYQMISHEINKICNKPIISIGEILLELISVY